jgi:hypothetical protein
MRFRVALRVLAVLEVVGGVFGLITVPVALVRLGATANLVATAVIGVPFFLLAIFAGVMLWRERPSGYLASIVVQVPQLIKIATSQFAFLLGLGGDLSVVHITHQDPNGNVLRTVSVNSQGGSFLVIEMGRPPGAPLVFGVSIIPCVALVLLRKAGRAPAQSDTPPDNATLAEAGSPDGQPTWVIPFWLRLVLGLFVLLTICCCTGFLLPGRR